MGLPGGGVAIAYAEHDTSKADQDGIYLDIVSSTGVVKSSEVHVNATVLGVQSIPAIATLTNGAIIVAWIDGEPANGPDISTLRAQILDPNGVKLGDEIRIADTLKGGDAPSVTALADGRFSISWDSPAVTNGVVVGLNLHSQIFSQDGTTASPIFNVTTASVDNAYRVEAPAETQLVDGTIAYVGELVQGTTSTIHTDLFSLDAIPPAQPPGAVTLTKLPTDITVGSLPANEASNESVILAGDLNHDGKMDLVVTVTEGCIPHP